MCRRVEEEGVNDVGRAGQPQPGDVNDDRRNECRTEPAIYLTPARDREPLHYVSEQEMARRIGAPIVFSAEAERHYRAAIAGHPVDTEPQPAPKSSRRFHALFGRTWGRRGYETDS